MKLIRKQRHQPVLFAPANIAIAPETATLSDSTFEELKELKRICASERISLLKPAPSFQL